MDNVIIERQRGQMIAVVFFFQAEDGIRDHCVTGVQTCALPISNILHQSVFASQEANI